MPKRSIEHMFLKHYSFWKSRTVISILLTAFFVTVPSIAFAFDFMNTIYDLVHGGFGALVRAGGLLLNYAISDYVAGFGRTFLTAGVGVAVDATWVVVRDIVNLLFIFGLVYIGFKLILESGDSSAKKMLGMLIAAGLLVNFSLFITKTVVDFSNLAAAQIAGGFQRSTGSGPEYEVSGSFMGVIGLQSIYEDGPEPSNTAGGTSVSWFMIIGTMILFIVAAFVFAAGGIVLIIRFAVLNIYMILSPIMFLGWIFPGLQRYSSEYWSGFLSRCFVAPAYLLMLYLSYNVLFSMKQFISTDYGKAFGEDTGGSSFAVIAYYALAISFLVASLVIAQKMGAQGASAAVSLGNRGTSWARSKATGVATGGARLAYSGAAYLPRAVVNKIGEAAQSGVANLEARRGTIGAIARFSPVNKALRGAAKATAEAKLGTGSNLAEERKYNEETAARTTKKRALNEAIRGVANVSPTNTSTLSSEDVIELSDLDTQHNLRPGTLTLAQEARRQEIKAKQKEALEKAALDISVSDLENMSQDEREKVAPYLSESKLDGLDKSTKISDADKDKINSVRKNAIESILTANGTNFAQNVTKLTAAQIETLGEDWIKTNAHLLTGSQMDDIKKNKNFTDSQKTRFSASRDGNFNNISGMPGGTDKTTAIKQLLEKKSPTEVAKLPYNILTSEEALPYITSKVLKDILKNNSLTSQEMYNLGSLIIASTAGNSDARLYLSTPEGEKQFGI